MGSQEPVLSATLFLLVINDIDSNAQFSHRLFANKPQVLNHWIVMSHRRNTRSSMGLVHTWGIFQHNNFRFFPTKTYIAVFPKKEPIPSLFPLRVNDQLVWHQRCHTLLKTTPPPQKKPHQIDDHVTWKSSLRHACLTRFDLLKVVHIVTPPHCRIHFYTSCHTETNRIRV